MGFLKNTFLIGLITLILSLSPSFCIGQGLTHGQPIQELWWQNSPKVKALGGCSITNIESQSQCYNPATIGIYGLDKTIFAGISNDIKYLPEYVYDKLSLQSKGFSLRLLPLIDRLKHKNFDYSIAMGYVHNRLAKTTKYEIFDQDNNLIDYSIYGNYLYWESFTCAFAYRKNPVLLGFGYSYLDMRETYYNKTGELKGDCSIFGTLFGLKVLDIDSRNYKSAYRLTLLAAFVWNDKSSATHDDDIYCISKRSALAISSIFDCQPNSSLSISVIPSFQYENHHFNYYPDTKRFGIEVGFNDAIYIRIGHTEKEIFSDPYGRNMNVANSYYIEDYGSYGVGFSFNGIINNIFSPKIMGAKQNNLLTHFDIRFDFAHSRLFPSAKTNFYHLSISI